MRKLFATTLILTLSAALGLLLVDFVFPKLWFLAIFSYLWGIGGMVVVAPGSFIALLIPESRRRIGVPILMGNLAAVVILVWCVNTSVSVEAMMSI